VDDDQGFGRAREATADLLRVRPEVPLLDVDQHGARLEPPHRFHRGDEGVRRHNDLIPLTDAAGGQPQD
jgi:hypothetical protein